MCYHLISNKTPNLCQCLKIDALIDSQSTTFGIFMIAVLCLVRFCDIKFTRILRFISSLVFCSVWIIPSALLSAPFLISLMAIFNFLKLSYLFYLEISLVYQHELQLLLFWYYPLNICSEHTGFYLVYIWFNLMYIFKFRFLSTQVSESRVSHMLEKVCHF